MKRYSGVLMSVTSLPSKYGIGCFDKAAYDFVDWLEKAGQKYWQILPLGATSHSGAFDSPYQNVKDIHAEYVRLVEVAKTKTKDMPERYAAFAAAEAYYLENAMVIPYGITGGSYQVTHLNVFEGQYASYGQASNRYKGQWIYTTPMSQEQFDSEMAKWQDAVSASK